MKFILLSKRKKEEILIKLAPKIGGAKYACESSMCKKCEYYGKAYCFGLFVAKKIMEEI